MTSVKYKGEKHTGPGHQAPYPLSRLAPPIDLIELARAVAAAEDALFVKAAGKLRLLVEQMEKLQQQARLILQKTRKSQELHWVNCSFCKNPGHEYHLYSRPDPLIAPGEWRHRGAPRPFQFVGAYRLEQDQTWTEVMTASAEP